MVRAFIAIEIPSSIKKNLADVQSHLKTAGADVSWTKPDNLHLTLKFLGEISDSQITIVRSAVNKICEKVSAFELEIGDIGVFPNPRRPRIIWAGVSGDLNAVLAIQSTIDSELVSSGFATDAHPFNPHLTLGRIKTPKRTRELLALADVFEIPKNNFRVDRIIVMRSQLNPTGSIYTPIEICRFGQ
ncbi:MAG TPA: RNA 2',3'-cyclic phosphodiesterase [Blastocatellia bacterium]|nr:RNA 2',3'-cyclic phosphodiesterase [Blastocatellia bacterium]